MRPTAWRIGIWSTRTLPDKSMEDYQSFTKLTKRRGISKLFAEDFLEEKEIELEDIEKLKEKIVATQKDREEEVFDYVPISSEQKKKIVTQEKIVPQLFMLGDKIKEKISFGVYFDIFPPLFKYIMSFVENGLLLIVGKFFSK